MYYNLWIENLSYTFVYWRWSFYLGSMSVKNDDFGGHFLRFHILLINSFRNDRYSLERYYDGFMIFFISFCWTQLVFFCNSIFIFFCFNSSSHYICYTYYFISIKIIFIKYLQSSSLYLIVFLKNRRLYFDFYKIL